MNNTALPPMLRNQVLCCDALVLMRSLPDGCIDAIIGDPPYNMTELDFDKQVIDWRAFWIEARRVVKSKRSPIILFSQQPFTTDLIVSNRKAYRQEIIYEKTMPVGYLDANRRPLQAHENILVFGEMLPDYFPQMEQTTDTRATARKRTGSKHYNDHKGVDYVDNGKRYPTTVWRFAQRNTAFKKTKTLHPTQKPIGLMDRLVLSYTRRGDIILDPFAGSGTTAVAARQNDRDYLICENNLEYYATALNRLQQDYTVSMFA